RQDKDRSTLRVDLQRPLAPASPAPPDPRAPLATLRLNVWLRPAPARPAPGGKKERPGELSLPFPDVVPVGARYREGALAIDYEQNLYEAGVVTTAVATAPAEDAQGPWGKQTPDYYFPFRGRPPQGTLRLKPR